ncbi:GrpB family protein [Halobacillus halophilus]|uniref:GrpB family protein n=1 Tax=Halobacillus halophilus TaxID=1570 RepID=UPI001CD4AD5A|nr:GrpB family protein [Halobacillus halophilus]MCA1009173.1 GrpB family protein [Halobacillus halophilus]
MRRVQVNLYDETWPLKYEAERKKLERIFQSEVIDIFHIGSTSVAGLKSKPVIDIMIIVKDIDRVNQFNQQMRMLNYVPGGEHGMTGRRFFQKGGDLRTHHVHVFEQGDANVTRHLAFRDYLRCHSEVRKEYGKLKHLLAIQFPNDLDSYIEGKSNFVSKIESKALAWYESH